MRRLRLCFAGTDTGGPGFPSGPTTGVCHCELAGRGQASGAKSPSSHVPGRADQGLKERRGGTPEGVAVCSVSRRSGKQAAAVTKVRLSAFRLPSLFEGRTTANLGRICAARMQKFGCLTCESGSERDAATYSAVIRGLDPRTHRSSQESLRSGWIAGSSPAMTRARFPSALRCVR
jgi:hypothetical protein